MSKFQAGRTNFRALVVAKLASKKFRASIDTAEKAERKRRRKERKQREAAGGEQAPETLKTLDEADEDVYVDQNFKEEKRGST
jgi:hypothetical protein